MAVLYENDLAPMIDSTALPGEFNEIPSGAFLGPGSSFAGGKEYVLWPANFLTQRSCADVNITPWSGSVNISLQDLKGDDGPTAQVNIAPMFGNVALLGELGKITAV